jgi:CYTH domain-containing protein
VAVGVEREIRFVVTEGEAPRGGRAIEQGYLLRRPASLRVRLIDDSHARVTLKLPRSEGRFEWEVPIPASLARVLLALPLPRVAKHRRLEGRLEVDSYRWPRPLIICECELEAGEGPDLRDAAARSRFMEEHRPEWVRAWKDVTDDPTMTAASLARRPSR